MSYLGLDVWDKRVGIALCIEGISLPFSIVPRHKIVNEIKKIIFSKNIQTIVVGLPYDLYNVRKKQLEKTEKFIEKLRNIFPEKEIVWVDERYTSFEAENIQKELWWEEKYIDDKSAFLILEAYLNSRK